MESSGFARRLPLGRPGARIVGLACGLGLLLATGLAYTQTSGTVSASVSAPASGTVGATGFALVTPMGAGTGATQTCGVSTQYGVFATPTASPTGDTPVGTGWTPMAGSNGVTGTGADMYCVGVAKGQKTLVTVSLTNAAALSQSYSSLSMPINVWSASGTSWTVSSQPDQFLSLINGYVSFTLDNSAGSSDAYYEVAMDGGNGSSGSFYCLSTSGTLAPQFYAQATAL